MIDDKGTILRNLEDQVQYLTDINQLASLGFRVKGTVTHSSFLVVDATCVNGDIMIVGVEAPFHLWTFVIDEWIDLGEFPRSGPPGARGATGARGSTGPMGPQGPVGPTGATGKNGKNGDGLGVENITHLDLAVGDPTVNYSNVGGARLSKQGQIVAAGQQYDVTVYDEMPILPGENVTITADSAHKGIVVNAATSPVKSVNGKTGTVVLKTSDLENNSNYITNSYHDNSKQDTLVSGTNIKTINNQSLLGSGNITISGGGGSGGVESVNGKTGAITLAAGNNVTINESGNTLTINASGGGGSGTDGFNNLKGLTLTPTMYQGAESPSGKFAFTGSGTYTLKDNSSGGIQELSFQLPVIPGNGIIFDKTTDGNCEIKAADYKPTITLETSAATQNTSHYNRIYYSFTVDSTVANDVANGKYNVIIYDQTSGGGYYYCPLQGDTMTFLGEEIPNGAGGPPSYIVGWSFKAKESETAISFWRDSLSLGGGGGGGSTYSVVEITSSTSTLTDEQYNTLTASPFNKIKLNNTTYDLYEETSARLVYTANYFNNGYQITIDKSTKAVSTGSLSSLVAISAFVKNDLNYNQNNNRFALSAYQGKVLNDRLTALETAVANLNK